jgi:hypothetical protein
MGYDIYTRESDMKLSEKFARKYGYAYLFKPLGDNELTVEQLINRTDIPDSYRFAGDARVYFRANIWGMNEVRRYFTDLFNELPETQRNEKGQLFIDFIDAISWNEGRHVKVQEILTILQTIQYFGQDVGQNELVEEFIEYMEIASTLDGFHVW